VNDAPALKRANVGIAVAGATAAAKGAADIILTQVGASLAEGRAAGCPPTPVLRASLHSSPAGWSRGSAASNQPAVSHSPP
jgi:hypothetical protein